MWKKNLNFVDRHALWPPFQIQQQFVRDPLIEKKYSSLLQLFCVPPSWERRGKGGRFHFFLSWFAIAKSFFSISIIMASLCNSKMINNNYPIKKQVAFDLFLWFFCIFFPPSSPIWIKEWPICCLSSLCVRVCCLSPCSEKNCLDEIVRRVLARWWE